MSGMVELTPTNAASFLLASGWVQPGPMHATELAEGVSNAVLRIETSDRTFVLKQARPQLRTKDPWFSDISRIWRERDAMVLLRPLLPAGAVPDVLFCDEANYVFAMSHAPEPFRNWRAVLLGGEIDVALGEQVGRLLGTIHDRTARLKLNALADRTIFEQLRVDPFYVRVQQRVPDLADAIAPLVERCRTRRLGLCHGDFSPKNLLLHAGGFTLVDYETCHWGDVTFDLGFFLSHLLLKAIHLPDKSGDIVELTQAFWRGYSSTVTLARLSELTAAGIGHLGGCLLARVDGTSPAPYLTVEPHRDLARHLGRRLLRARPQTWDEVVNTLEAILRQADGDGS